MAKKAPAPAKRTAASPKKSAKKPAARKAPPAKTSPAKTAPAKTASTKAQAKRATAKTPRATSAVSKPRRAAKPPAEPLRTKVDSYVATLNDWRKECVAGLRTMIRKAAPLVKDTGTKVKDLGKKEFQELVRLAAKLNEIKGSPPQRSKGKAKHK